MVPVESESSLNMISIAETIARWLNRSVLKNTHSLPCDTWHAAAYYFYI